MPKNFYISDLHIGHENILRFDSRPFASTDEMLREITKRWNEVVSLNDYVYILGDFSFRCSPDVRNAAISVLHGRKILIRGNHDKGIPLMGDGPSLCAAARNGQRLMNVADYMEIEDGGRKVVLSHYPMMAWNGSFHGSIHPAKSFCHICRLQRSCSLSDLPAGGSCSLEPEKQRKTFFERKERF